MIRCALSLVALTILLHGCSGAKHGQTRRHQQLHKAAEQYCLDPPVANWLDECDESESGICIFVLDIEPGTPLISLSTAEEGGRLSHIHGTQVDSELSPEAIARSMVESIDENSRGRGKRTRFEVVDWLPMTISGLPGHFFTVSIDYTGRIGEHRGFIGERCLESFALTVDGSKLHLLSYAPGYPCSGVKDYEQGLAKFKDLMQRFRTRRFCKEVNAPQNFR